MHDIAEVDTFTASVPVLDDGDPVSESSTEPTVQALTNRTRNVFRMLTEGPIVVTADVADTTAATFNGLGTGAGVRGVGGAGGAGGDFFGIGSGGTEGAGSGDYAIVSRQNIWMFGADPAPTTGFTNMLTPMNLIKAWAVVECTGGGTPTILKGFNVTNPAYAGSALQVDLVDNLTNHGVVLPGYNGGGASKILSGLIVSDAGATVQLQAVNDAGASVNLSAEGASCRIFFIVLGAQ